MGEEIINCSIFRVTTKQQSVACIYKYLDGDFRFETVSRSATYFIIMWTSVSLWGEILLYAYAFALCSITFHSPEKGKAQPVLYTSIRDASIFNA